MDIYQRVIDDIRRTLVGRLRYKKISLRSLERGLGLSIRWLMGFLIACFSALPEHLHAQPLASSQEILLGCLEIERDALWSFGWTKTIPLDWDRHGEAVETIPYLPHWGPQPRVVQAW